MDIIEDLKKRAIRLNEALQSGEAMQDIIADNEPYIVDMNTEEQLYEKGINALGVNISDYAPYSPVTMQIKQGKGQPYNRVTLRDTGDFHRSFFLEIDSDRFTFKATDVKSPMLQKKYGRQIFGLTDDNIKSLIWDFIFPDLVKFTKSIL